MCFMWSTYFEKENPENGKFVSKSAEASAEGSTKGSG